MSETNYLELDEIALIHQELIDLYGGMPGIKSTTLLDSAANRPRFKGHYEGADIITQAAALMFGLAKNHAFHDGNKRIAAVATSVFLRINGWRLTCGNDALATFVEGCSASSWTEEAVIAFVQQHAQPRDGA